MKEVLGPGYTLSRGFFPTEMCFSERLIPTLKQLGIEWSVVSGEHISRACPDFPVQLGSGDLFSLLNLLRPDLVIDRPTFERMAEPNAAINAAIAAVRRGGSDWRRDALDHLAEAAATDWKPLLEASFAETIDALIEE
jgi:hypothetical protein